jgi:MFS family permease
VPETAPIGADASDAAADAAGAPAATAAPPADSRGAAMRGFIRRQQRDWIVTVLRTGFDRFAYQMVFPYLSIYIVALGASATQLGLVNSLGMAVAGLAGPFTGWLIDRYGPRSFYLVGIGLLGICYLTYGLAQSWEITFLAMACYWLGYSISGHSCATICGNCLVNRDRATAMMLCETVAAGVLGIAGPLLGALIVTSAGHVDPGSIRPLFFIAFGVTVVTFAMVWALVSPRRWGSAVNPRDFVREMFEVMGHRSHLKRWLVISAITGLPNGMVFAFAQVYAHEVKGADGFTLGLMTAAAAAGSILLAVPLGRLADRVGRKRVLYLTIPGFCASCLVLVWAPSPIFLILAGAMQSFFFLGGPIAAAMERELVPVSHMGRWIGILRVVRMLTVAVMVIVAGLIWDHVGPMFVFLAFVAIDMSVRLPLLVTMPETLEIEYGA